ncbi:hypothetical protein K8T06_13525, partial [bacterium]|nr:hypothetical protein [bacterium]
WVTDPQGDGGMHWFTPNFRIILFDGIKGLFTVNPILLPAIIALPFLWKRNRRLTWGLTFLVTSQTYINAVRRDWAGVGFGMRRFLNLTPAFALGLMIIFAIVNRPGKTVFRWLLWISGGILTVWNLLLMAQYYLSPLGEPWVVMTFKQMITRQWTMSPGLLLELIGSGLVFRGMGGDLLSLVMAGIALLLIVGFIKNGPTIASILRNRFQKRPDILIAAVFIAWITLTGWVSYTVLHAETFNVVNLLPGKEFGHLRPLKLNPESGYQGYAGGIVFGPGKQWKIIESRAKYVRERFIELGTLNLIPVQPVVPEAKLTWFFPDPVEAEAVHLISCVEPESSVVDGDFIGEISVTTQDGAVIRLPVIYGAPDGIFLLRDWPAVNSRKNKSPEMRTEYIFPTLRKIRSLTIRFNGQPIEWHIRGVAFE